MSAPTLLTPYGYSASSCGYCTPSGTRSAGPSSKKYGLLASQMSCQFYQNMIDRGWRRSGNHLYHPDMARTCCPQYTIRLDTQAFTPNKKHRQVINRWNRYLSTGNSKDGSQVQGIASEGSKKGKGKAKAGDRDFMRELRAFEVGYGAEGTHRFETELVPAKANEETFDLYKRYQVSVHKDEPGSITMRGFQRFLCDSPLGSAPIPYSRGRDLKGLPNTYGSYHLLYKVDGKIIGISVIDILPSCVSSVYFIWDPDWAWASLGKLSALREVALARDIREAGLSSMGWVYMGYWIAGCAKMRYKSEYEPSYLLDPGTNVFYPLTATLDRFLQRHPVGYYPFADLKLEEVATEKQGINKIDVKGQGEEDEDYDMDSWPTSPPPSFSNPSDLSQKDMESLLVLMKGKGMLARNRLVSFGHLEFGDPESAERQVREMVAAVGVGMMARSGTEIGDVRDKGILFFG